MTMTLEKIKGMNIAVGTPIEVEINSRIYLGVKQPDNKVFKELGYYRNVTEMIDDDKMAVPIISYDRATGTMIHPEESMKRTIEISSIESITILTPQK